MRRRQVIIDTDKCIGCGNGQVEKTEVSQEIIEQIEKDCIEKMAVKMFRAIKPIADLKKNNRKGGITYDFIFFRNRKQ